MPKLVLLLREIGPADLSESGGKAAGLARLHALGLPVPPAFVVTASFFEEMRSRLPDEPEIETLAGRLPPLLRETVDSALDSLGPAPHGYAVRSSAAEEDRQGASFAGIHESFLGLTREEVPAALFRCWASAFSQRAASYRRRMGLPSEFSAIRMGVVVQVMLHPSAAGVLFTRETGSPGDCLLVQAVAGSGESLVQGKVSPVSLLLSRDDGSPRAPVPPEIPVTLRALEQLSRMALAAEAAWGIPLDLEWAVEGERIFLLQARPLTAAPAPAAAGRPEKEGPPPEDRLWTRANLRELLPELPSVFFNSLMARVDWLDLYRRTGMVTPSGEMIRVIQGRPYFNLSIIGGMLASLGFSPSRFARAVGHGSDPPGPAERDDHPLRALLSHPVLHLRLQLRQGRTPREALAFFDRVHARSRRLKAEDPSRLSDAALLERLEEMVDYNREFLGFLMNGFNRVSSKMFAVEMLFPRGGNLDRFVNGVLGAGEKNVSVRQGFDLLRLARLARGEGRVVQYLVEGSREYRDYESELEGTRFLPAFRDYLSEYGHRGVQETDPSMPVYAEDPAFLLRAVGVAAEDPLAPDPEAMGRRQEEAAAAAWKDLRRTLPWIERGLPIRVLLLRGAIRGLREAMALRERIRFEGMRANADYRRFLREAGRRLRDRGLLEEPRDLFLLRVEEVEAVLAGRPEGRDLQEIVRRRREERRLQQEIPMPNVLRDSEIPRLGEGKADFSREEGIFRGLPVGPGRVEGRVVVLEGPHQVDRVRRGDILVAPTLDPSWIPLFTLASGLVVEMGGTLSHGSIIAREYGLPTVVNLPGITRKLRSGDRVFLDGGEGLVRRIEG